MFKLRNVKFKHILAIDDIFIPGDKITCIVGESGSGKSTLLKLLNNMISPDTGEITYKDENIQSINPVDLRRRVIMLPQQAAIFPGSVRDNLVIGLKFAGKSSPQDESLKRVLNTVKLNKGLDDSPEKFSGGEKQRLALARVLFMEPEVLLLDEPSSALDENTEDIVIENVVRYSKENNRGLVMVTHSRKIARTYGENIINLGGVEFG